ncbi:dethiobiotin synthase [Massilia timonae]|uniref:ATP-dependent dethiobiotin synthetase BioD n=1 Tax=Massilia timonae TaxID=47229 RepID=A0A1S2N663_9BURK|nr:dethiobiotin synthase [Massilia timonae]OIJ39762.1 dethiobiotin synthase [Massilia timonae]
MNNPNNLNDNDDPIAAPPAAVPEVDLHEPAHRPELEPELEARATDGLPSRFACFVTGTDTEIGKTLVSSAILHKLAASGVRACGMKPVAAGAELRDGELHNDDADMLVAAGNVHLPSSITTPYMLREPAAPHIAAALENVTIESAPIIAAFAEIQAASDAVVVEGVGGFRVPFNDNFDSADLAAQLNLPVILVVGMRLGCISHALLTVEAIVARGLVLAGWVANTVDPKMGFELQNIEALAQRIPAPLLGRVPRLHTPTAAAAAEFIDLAGLPGWPSTRGQS